MVQDGAKKRPTLEPDPATVPVVQRIFGMAEAGNGILDITRTLNGEGIANPTGKLWSKNGVHIILRNEVCTGALVWGTRAKDKAKPVRMEDAFPAIVTRQEFQRIASMLQSRAPKKMNPRRAASPYLLSGIVKCQTCGKALSGQESKSGQFAYYVCQSLLKQGSGACETPRLNAKSFEGLIVGQIWENVLTESNIRDLVRLVDEEMDGTAREQREKLETVESELAEVRRRLDRLWHTVENTDLEINDILPRIREHKERQEKLEIAAEDARAVLAERRVVLDDVDTITAHAKEMSEFLKTSELTETRAFVRSFVKEVVVRPGKATILYTIPTPEDSPIGGADAAEVALSGRVMNTVHSGGPDWTKSRTEADSEVTPSDGMGMVYVSTASSSTISMPCTKLRMRAFRSGNVPSCRNSRKSDT